MIRMLNLYRHKDFSVSDNSTTGYEPSIIARILSRIEFNVLFGYFSVTAKQLAYDKERLTGKREYTKG